jgi:hypothetical protein
VSQLNHIPLTNYYSPSTGKYENLVFRFPLHCRKSERRQLKILQNSLRTLAEVFVATAVKALCKFRTRVFESFCNIYSKYFEMHAYPLIFKVLAVTNFIFVKGSLPQPVENRRHFSS